MATDFYMTLPSNASMEMHPDNTLTHYVTHLPQRIDLTGEWECGLAEVQYPHTWYNVTDNDVWFFLNTIDATDSSRRSKLSCGYYDDPLTLMYHVNKGLYSMRTEKTQAQMSYSSVTQKMTLHMTENTLFTIPYHSGVHVRIPRTRSQRAGGGYVISRPPRRLPPSRLVVPLPHRGRRCGEPDAGVRHPLPLHGHRGVLYTDIVVTLSRLCCAPFRLADVTVTGCPLVSLTCTTYPCCARTSPRSRWI